VTTWLASLTLYGCIDLGSDLFLVAAAIRLLHLAGRIQRDVTSLTQSETYGHHARRTQ